MVRETTCPEKDSGRGKGSEGNRRGAWESIPLRESMSFLR